MQATSQHHALLAGGGSGGHVFPALAIAETLIGRGWRVSYTGAPASIESRQAAARGLPFHPLAARPVVGQGAVGKARGMTVLVRSAFAARPLVRRLGVDVVVGTGGYVAVPAVLGGWLARRPVLLFEPNASAGVANRTLSRLATEAALAYARTAEQLRCPTTVTGVPVREAFFVAAETSPIESLPTAPRRLLVLGGSQGAQQLNDLVPAALACLDDAATGVHVTHQCGPRHLAATAAAYANQGRAVDPRPNVDVVPFIDDMPAAMASSHLVVSRAGAITLAELAAAGRPSILVPLAIAGGHQVDNAEAVAAAGAARVLAGTAATPEALAGHLETLLTSPAAAEHLQAMADAAGRLAHRDAGGAIADRLAALVAVAGGRAS